MKKSHFAVLVCIGIYLGIYAVPVEARSVIRTGDAISVEQDQKIEGDFYTLANILTISGEITEDLLSVGRKVTVNGSVGADAFIGGETINVHGQIADDLRVIGGDVTIAEPVAGDLFVLAGTVTVLSTASIGGDVIVYGGSVTISGPVSGAIMGRAESLLIDTSVTGPVTVTSFNLSLGDKANLAKGVTYVSPTTLNRSPNAIVAGDVVRNDPLTEQAGVTTRQLATAALTLLFAALVWYLVARSVVIKVVERAMVPSLRAIAIGLAAVFISPFVIGVLLVSMLGILAGAALFMAYGLFLLLALFTTGAVLAQLVAYAYKKSFISLSPLLVLLGTGGVCVLLFIPVVGAVLFLALFVLTLGAMVDLIFHSAK